LYSAKAVRFLVLEFDYATAYLDFIDISQLHKMEPSIWTSVPMSSGAIAANGRGVHPLAPFVTHGPLA
jgi:hypothetical protein